jgi:diketogulonate reductase-like aldo/keto reductase
MKTMEEKAIEIAKLMEDGKGNDVTLLDISGLNSWTDYFVIVTVTSSAHWQGLYKQIKEYIKENDLEIIERVATLAERLGVTMTEVALAWTLAKGVAAPIVGATKVPHFDAAVRAMDLTLSREDIAFLEEPYKAHEIVGALARTDSNGI